MPAEVKGTIRLNITGGRDNIKEMECELSNVEVITPINDNDIATKEYVNDQIAAIPATSAAAAEDVTVDAEGFEGLLTTGATDVQAALEEIDALEIPTGFDADEITVDAEGFAGLLGTSDTDVQTALATIDTMAMANPMSTEGAIIYGGDNEGTPTSLEAGTEGDVLTMESGSPAWKAPTKSLLEYVNDFDLSSPPAYGMFMIVGNFDPYTMQAYPNYTITASLASSGQLTYKRYNAAGTVVETKTVYSGESINIDTNNSNATETPYGKLTKISIEPADTANPITTNSIINKLNLIAVSFGTSYWDGFTTMVMALKDNKGLVKCLYPSTMDTITDFSSALHNCYMLESLTMPTSMSACTTFLNAFINCWRVASITFPSTVGAVTTLANAFTHCYKLPSVVLPATMNNVTTLMGTFSNCHSLTSITLPTSMTALTSMEYTFANCHSLETIILPATLNNLTSLNAAFIGCYKLTSITLPTSCTALNNISNLFFECNNLVTIPELASPGTNQINMTTVYRGLNAEVFDQSSARTSKLSIGGVSADFPTIINSIEIDWANSTYGGASPHIDLRWNNLDATEIDRIFTALPTATKIINVAGNPGSATCDTSIVTTKNWTAIVS